MKKYGKIDDLELIRILRERPRVSNKELAQYFDVTTHAIMYKKRVLTQRGDLSILPLKKGRPTIPINIPEGGTLSDVLKDLIDRAATLSLEGTIALLKTITEDLEKKREQVIAGVPGIMHRSYIAEEDNVKFRLPYVNSYSASILQISQYQDLHNTVPIWQLNERTIDISPPVC